MNAAYNPALSDIAFLVGEWSIGLSSASFLAAHQTARFSVTYEWKADGSVIAVQQKTEGQSATWIIGRDESEDYYTVLYADSRGVSRVYSMTFKNNTWKMWRNNPAFSQRFEGTLSKDKNTINAYWEKSTDGKEWEHDFDMVYTRL